MRRATAAVAGTFAGAALILGAKVGADRMAAEAGQAAGATGDLAPAPEPPAEPAKPPPPTGGANGGGAAGNGLKNGVFRGAVAGNRYGPIRVTIRVAGGRITGVAASHATSPAKTLQVNRRAMPVLKRETLAAQSADIDTVSGATYTSGSFTTSLQSALAAARG